MTSALKRSDFRLVAPLTSLFRPSIPIKSSNCGLSVKRNSALGVGGNSNHSSILPLLRFLVTYSVKWPTVAYAWLYMYFSVISCPAIKSLNFNILTFAMEKFFYLNDKLKVSVLMQFDCCQSGKMKEMKEIELMKEI